MDLAFGPPAVDVVLHPELHVGQCEIGVELDGLFQLLDADVHRRPLRARIELQGFERRGRGPVERKALPGDACQRFTEPVADLLGQLVDAGQDVRARPGPGRAGEDDRLAVGIDQLGRQEVFVADSPDAADEQGLDALAESDLAAEAGPHGRVAVSRLGQEFEGHLAVEGGVLGQEDLAHAAAAELAEDGVLAGDRPAGGPFRRRRRRGGEGFGAFGHGLVPGLS
jgi:hypothetical protein